MSVATASYPGVLKVHECEYTQTLGVDPDAIALRIVPQATNIAASGTVTFGYTGQTSITLPNCTIDKARTTYNTEGFVTSITLLDRRELWKNVSAISGRYNIIRNGSRITATQKTLRELVELLILALGEISSDVSAVSNVIYPEVNWFCEEPRLALMALLNEWGYVLELGFGSEPVTIHQIGTGTALPTTAVMMQSTGVDAMVQPQYLQFCFGPSVMQARLELEAVALDTDDTYDLLADVSYKPTAGWEKADPQTFSQVRSESGEAEQLLAQASVYKVYRVKQFSDGDLIIPDGSGVTLNSIDQIFPIENRLLETITTRSNESQRIYARLYGVAQKPEGSTGVPIDIENSGTDDALEVDFSIDGERGLVLFKYPIFKIVSEEYKPADLYLECSFSIRDNTTNQYAGYSKTVTFDAGGTGTRPVQWLTERGETIVTYSTGHARSGSTDNQSDLDTLANNLKTAISGRFAATATQMIVYQYPRLNLRLDGIRQQIQHIISCGEGQPGSYTVASVGMEFDTFATSRTERAIRTHGLKQLERMTASRVMEWRGREAND